jgi:ubiquinone/menaquinone biosynthesis C-methylase UbiE
MDTHSVAAIWNDNAENWTLLSRQGYDTFRDHVNTPAFMGLLPDVAGLKGLDIGCGEGTNTRRVAARGATLSGIDVAQRFVAFARERELSDPLGIDYQLASATALPFAAQSFDFATAFMSIMDIPEQELVLREALRVLRPGGFLQFSICHPCFHTPRFAWIRDEEGRRVALEVGDYFTPHWGSVEEWTFGSAPQAARDALPEFRLFRVPRFDRILSEWLNLILDAGFVLERFCEPTASDEALAACPKVEDTRVISYSLIIRCRKPG